MKNSIVNTLQYFDIFLFPLKADELRKWLHTSTVTDSSLEEQLAELATSQTIQYDGEYIALGNLEQKRKNRLEKEKNAAQLYAKVNRYARIIAAFPFVKAVFISGSLSKGCLAKDGDIDYFVITERNKLWLSRLLLGIFKKIFLLNSRKYFCLNYFIDEDSMEIRDKNMFTATEIKSLQPVYNLELANEFFALNDQWANNFLPNFERYTLFAQVKVNEKRKARVESILKALIPSSWNKAAMHVFNLHKKIKYVNVNPIEVSLNFRAQAGISKIHPQGMQTRVLNEYNKRTNKHV